MGGWFFAIGERKIVDANSYGMCKVVKLSHEGIIGAAELWNPTLPPLLPPSDRDLDVGEIMEGL